MTDFDRHRHLSPTRPSKPDFQPENLEVRSLAPQPSVPGLVFSFLPRCQFFLCVTHKNKSLPTSTLAPWVWAHLHHSLTSLCLTGTGQKTDRGWDVKQQQPETGMLMHDNGSLSFRQQMPDGVPVSWRSGRKMRPRCSMACRYLFLLSTECWHGRYIHR